ncbi:MAG: DUF1501 domain-containing protein [Burkholderiales bacterium]
MNASRRHFFRSATGLAAFGAGQATPLALSLAGLGALASQSSHAADTSGYKALVCLYLNGGSDMHNWLVPTDPTNYASYAAARRELAWQGANLQALTQTRQASGRSFGMPLELSPLRSHYEAGRVAALANVGPLMRPVTKAEYQQGSGLPAKLFSHNDQTSAWQSLQPEGAPSGWGGRMGDILMSANAQPVFTAISATGNAVFLAGGQAVQYQVGNDGPVGVRALRNSWTMGSTQLAGVLNRSLVGTTGDAYSTEYATVMRRSLDTTAALQAALAQGSVAALPTTGVTLGNSGNIVLANEGLARQLRMVARLIVAGQRLGMRRQVFMVSMGGFDTHASQMRDQPVQMAKVALSMDYFLNAISAQGLANNVTLFTASEFGRTLVSNGDGSDHGWGSHQFIAGGAVRGRDIYGRFPIAAVGSPDEVGSGRLLPTTSVTQMAGTLASWMGVSPSEQAYVLPNLNAFAPGGLGFI